MILKTDYTQRKLTLGDFTIAYYDEGKGDVPIVFIHAFPLNKETWHEQIDYFASGNRVIAFDIRGFGASTAGMETASIELYTRDLINFLAALAIEKVIVCGISMGGYIALCAIQSHPNKFKALVLCNTQCAADSEAQKKKRSDTIDHVKQEGLTLFCDEFLSNALCTESIQSKHELLQELKKTILSNAVEAIVAGLSALKMRNASCKGLSAINQPCLIMHGTEDVIIPMHNALYLHENCSNSSLIEIKRAGHLINIEQAQAFNWHLAKFTATLQQ